MAEPLKATFFAFRKRERGGVLLGASIAYLVVAVLIGAAFAALNFQGIMDYFQWSMNLGVNADKATGAEAFMPPPSVMGLIPAYLLALIVFYLLFAAYEAACLRWMIHGETGGLFGLSLGADTWRVWAGYWLWLVLIIVFYIVIAAAVGGLVMGAIAAGGGSPGDGGMAAMALAPLLGLALFAALVFFAVRFAPAGATSVALRRFAFFDAWKVTKGRFWALFGSFFLLLVLFFLFYLVVSLGVGIVVGVTVASRMGEMGELQTTQQVFQALANPTIVAAYAIMLVLVMAASMMVYVAWFGVNARAAVAALEEGKIGAPAAPAPAASA